MNEKEILDQIKKEPMEIPDSVKPESMREKLDIVTIQKTKKSWWRRGTPYVTAAAILTCCLLSIKLYSEQQVVAPTVPQSTILQEKGKNMYPQAYQKMKKNKREEVSWEQEQMREESMLDSGGMNVYGYDDKISENVKGSYSKTNVRTEGVDEGDFVKTDGTYIYTLYEKYEKGDINKIRPGYHVDISKIDGKTVNSVSDITLPLTQYWQVNDMYLVEDSLVIVTDYTPDSSDAVKKLYKEANAPYENFTLSSWPEQPMFRYDVEVMEDFAYNGTAGKKSGTFASKQVNYTITYVYDLKDRTNPELQVTTFQDGYYQTSRMVNGILYTISNRDFASGKVKKNIEETYIPQIGGELVSPDAVSVQEDEKGYQYTVISAYDVKNGTYVGQFADYGNCDSVYVSAENIYTISFWNYTSDIDPTVYNFRKKSKKVYNYSKVNKFSYGDGRIAHVGSTCFQGNIEDDYSVDEYNGYLRMVTTYYEVSKGININALYIFDENMKCTGKIDGIAKNESIYSALFHKDMAYFVTYEQTDPLFSVDLSDPENPKIVGELKMPGYSDYLHMIDDTHLLGIGVEQKGEERKDYLKLAIYDISNAKKVKEVSKVLLPDYSYAEVMYNANALYINTQRQEFGFGANFWGDPLEIRYLLFSYKDNQIQCVKEEKLESKSISEEEYAVWDLRARCVRVEDDYYLVTSEGKVGYFLENKYS